jgi:hypothetical protein
MPLHHHAAADDFTSRSNGFVGLALCCSVLVVTLLGGEIPLAITMAAFLACIGGSILVFALALLVVDPTTISSSSSSEIPSRFSPSRSSRRTAQQANAAFVEGICPRDNGVANAGIRALVR